MMTDVRCDHERARRLGGWIGRRTVLRAVLAGAGALGLGTVLRRAAAAQRAAGGGAPRPNSALALARFLNNAAYRDFPPKAIEHANSKLPASRLERVMALIHDFDTVKRVNESTVSLAPAGR